MRAFAEKRLAELKQELETGQRQLTLLDARSTELRATLTRIAGAIQVLEEVLASPEGARPPAEPVHPKA